MGVVAAHTLHAFVWDQNPLVFRIFDTIFNQSSVLFFFIAGFMFQYLSTRFDKWDYWAKKFRFVILPYLVLSIPAIYYYTQIAVQDNTWQGFYDNPLYEQVFYFLITGKQLAPFWFVPTITLFYIIAPLLIRADRDRRIYWLLPIFMLVSLIHGRSGPYGPIDKAVYLFSVYLFGMFASNYHDKMLEIVDRYRYLLFAIVAVIVVLNSTIPGYEQYLQYVLKILLCPLMLFFLDRIDDLIGDKFNYLAHVSFGVFFVHAYVLPAVKLSYLSISGNSSFPQGNVFGYITLTITVILGSMLVIFLCQRVLGSRSRMVLGA